jgi:hypothetical protein
MRRKACPLKVPRLRLKDELLKVLIRIAEGDSNMECHPETTELHTPF